MISWRVLEGRVGREMFEGSGSCVSAQDVRTASIRKWRDDANSQL